MPQTYEPIATTTLATGATSVSFTSIPSAYTDLVVIGQCGVSNNDYLVFRVGNGSVDTGSNYNRTYLQGDGSGVGISRNNNQTKIYIGETVSIMNNSLNYTFSINLMNYANTTTYKTFLNRVSNNGTWAGAAASVGLWKSTSAINVITISPDTNDGRTFIAGSTFTLYGIKAA